jgi:hypothetical protein
MVAMHVICSFRLGWLARLTLGLGAVVLFGCGMGAKGDCPALVSCGGNPVGNWKVSGPEAACQVFPVRPSQPVDVTDFTGHMGTPQGPTIAPPQANAVVLQQTTSGDWCSSLALTPNDTVENANLWHEAPELVAGTVSLAGDGTYISSLTFSTKNFSKERNTTHFAPRCLLANGGGHPDPVTGLPSTTYQFTATVGTPPQTMTLTGACAALAVGLNKYYIEGRINPTVVPNFADITCADAPSDGGCDCAGAYTVVVDDVGSWSVPKGDLTTLLQDSTALTYNGVEVKSMTAAASFKSSFCASPNQLQLTGPAGGSLYTLQGLRTMVLSPM